MNTNLVPETASMQSAAIGFHILNTSNWLSASGWNNEVFKGTTKMNQTKPFWNIINIEQY